MPFAAPFHLNPIEFGTLLVLGQNDDTKSFLDGLRGRPNGLNWRQIDRWRQKGEGYLVILFAPSGEHRCQIVADDMEDLFGPVLRLAADNAEEVGLIQADGIVSPSDMEAINAHWVAVGGLSNPTYDPSVTLH